MKKLSDNHHVPIIKKHKIGLISFNQKLNILNNILENNNLQLTNQS